MKWIEFKPGNEPECSGVYGFWLADGTCFYIGQSKKIARRIKTASHPYRLAQELNRVRCFYIPCHKKEKRQVEKAQIKAHQPIGNNGHANGITTFYNLDGHWNWTYNPACELPGLGLAYLLRQQQNEAYKNQDIEW